MQVLLFLLREMLVTAINRRKLNEENNFWNIEMKNNVFVAGAN